MQKLPQTMINVSCSKRLDLSLHEEVQGAIHDAERQLEGRGRVLLRPSGTEPLIRVMVEGQQADVVEDIARHLAEVVGRAVA